MIAWWWPIGRVKNVLLTSSLAAFLGFPLTVWSQLNDTGVDQYSDGVSFTSTEPALYPGQDPRYGRDAAAAVGQLPKVGGGAVGFDFTKLDNNGNPLSASASTWSCVRDNVTGRTWEVKTADGGLRDRNWRYSWYSSDDYRNGGQQYSGIQTPSNNPEVCGGSPADCNTEAYVAAVNQVGLCGNKDWRLPTVDELSSLLDYGIAYPETTIDEEYFPNTVGSWYWSSSVYAVDPNTAYVVHFYYGGNGTLGKDSVGRVRLVRGGQPLLSGTSDSNKGICNDRIPESTPTADFTLNNNGTALHNKTKLMWTRCALGQTWNSTTSACTGSPLTQTWQLGLQRAANFNFASYDDWRLPNHKELSSIVERRCYNPAINTTVFPTAPPYWFWSSSVYAGDPSTAWSLYFGAGFDLTYGKDVPFELRLVRGGQEFAAAFLEQLTVGNSGLGSGTVTSDPEAINCGAVCQASYINGTTVTLTATPNTASVFAGWGGDCNSSGQVIMNASKNCFATFNLSGNLPILSVTRKGTGTGMVTSSPAGISCGAVCKASYTSDTSVTLTATPAVGSVFAGWGGDCNSSGQVSMTASKECIATFNRVQFTLEVTNTNKNDGTVTSDPPGINCGGDCQETYNSGTVVTLTATPATGAVFAGWSGDCSNDGLVTMTANKGCVAIFTRPQYRLTLAKMGAGTGTVTSAPPPGINCGPACTDAQTTYANMTVVKLTATADTGSVFAGWSGDLDCSDGQVTMDADRACIATFDKPQQVGAILTVTRTGTGTGTVSSNPAGISCGVNCKATYTTDQTVTLTAVAAGGSDFTGWSGDCSGINPVIQFTMNTNRSCIATFTRLQYTLAVTKTGAGAGTVSSDIGGINCGVACQGTQQTYDTGTAVTLKATAAAGAVFAGWSGDCNSSGLVIMNTNKTCTASFIPQQYTLYVGKGGTGLGTVTSSDLGGINCDPACSDTQKTYEVGKVVKLTATADAGSGSVFAGWSGDCSGNNPVTEMAMTTDKVCVATFNATWFNLKVTRVGNGTVSSASTGISCGGDCNQSYISGTKVTLTATPSAGYYFKDWSGDCSGSNPVIEVTMATNKTCTARFIRQQYTLVVSNFHPADESMVVSSPSGITCDPDCTETYDSGTAVMLMASPAPGAIFAGWTGACFGLETTCFITMSGDKSVTASFYRP